MGHRCDYEDRIEIEYDYESETRYLVRVVRASYKNMSLDVYRELEQNTYYGEDRYFARNIMFCNMGGYLVTFPDEVYVSRSYYYGNYGKKTKQQLEDWCNTSKYNLCCTNILDKFSENNILELYPEFKYVLKKIPDQDKYIDRIMDLLEVWKAHPEIEGLCQLGFYEIALNKNLFKLTLPKRKQIIQWVMKNKELIDNPKYMKLMHIQKMIKHKISIEDYKDYCRNVPSFTTHRTWNNWDKWTADIPTYFYLKKKGYKDYKDQTVARLYYDYIKMAKKVGHDIEDPYWKYPSDIGKAHAKVMEEMTNIQNTASALQGEYLKAVMQPLADEFNAKVDGYDIFMPTDIEVIKKQCDVLYQCLLRNNYVNNVLMQEEILVFIWKDGNPVATAEVFYDKKLGQFYGDERGHKYGQDCKPPQDVIDAFDKWFKTFKPYKVKAERKKNSKRYYKGFHSVDSKGIFHTSFGGNFTFEVGKTYATQFMDEEIIAAGGQGCVSTNKVFHFCDSIEEISKHYQPTCYAEIEPLGPVVECNGALLSNRIKIVRALSDSDVALLTGALI